MSNLYTPEQAEQLRSQMIEDIVLPYIRSAFENHTTLQSAILLLAQYWADEANDAVHDNYIFSVLETPDLDAAFKAEEREWEDEEDYHDGVNLPDLPNHYDLGDYDATNTYWDDNGQAIPAFAAFCKEGAHQEMSTREAYSPYAIFRRDGEDIAIEMIGQKLRPWLEGIRPEWDEE